MSKSTTPATVEAVKAPAVEAVKGPIRVKANTRGYAFFKKLKGCPDLSTVKLSTVNGIPGDPIQEILLNEGTDAGNMLRRGYIAVGPSAEVEVEFKKNSILITPVVE
jgi:hypothetical protein